MRTARRRACCMVLMPAAMQGTKGAHRGWRGQAVPAMGQLRAVVVRMLSQGPHLLRPRGTGCGARDGYQAEEQEGEGRGGAEEGGRCRSYSCCRCLWGGGGGGGGLDERECAGGWEGS